MEEYDEIDGAPGHQLWLDEGPQFPEFRDVLGATNLGSDDEFYTAQDSNISVVYRMAVPTELNETSITLSFSNSSDGLYNSSTSVRINMNQTSFAENDYSEFEYNYTMDQRIVFFTAFNEYGWERSSASQPIFHKITTGFDLNVSFSEKPTEYTELDIITFNVTTTNQTTEDNLFFRYRYFENNTVDSPLLNWTSTNLITLVTNDTFVNVTQEGTGNWTQRRVDYNIRMDHTFNVSQKVEIQVYTEYLGQEYNESSPYTFIIQDSRPTFNLLSNNDTITNQANIFLDWDSSTVRGTVYFDCNYI